ncbi:SpoIIE family protein phosphatase [Beggiatoa leptomitoformis]|uniref:SpoIIE family protein phosphatase n=1 Tax=Beggiatoa leptomitoformis TaxID=288004 RepID=A0A2N9YBW6_9GAMM|nr:SpoIIE family protein phosphatase [Beggiatoa leptomitoformis]ALG66726.1 SpoIIE family protein phosphatase [Beggiatoa leptomitoformis]AUI67941.2 SpoIIE family protein phosphatase [Beggiatoa leptomitoformis]
MLFLKKIISQHSLSHRTMLSMAGRIALVVIGVTLLSYWHFISSLETQTLAQLEKYVAERGQRESSIFQLAEDNHKTLKQALLQQLADFGETDPKAEFDALFEQWTDGTTRNRLQGQPIEHFDKDRYPSTFIGKQVVIDADIRRRVLAFYILTKQYGRAWLNRFVDTYIMAPENIEVIYWADVAWGLDTTADIDIPKEEFFYISDKEHNPERKPVWTGVFEDPVPKLWMVSLETPVDDEQGRHIATLGHDIILNELLDRIVNNHLQGTQNILFREDGRLIAHPEFTEAIKAKGGIFDIQMDGNAHLQRIFKLAKNRNVDTLIINNPDDNEYLAVTQLASTDWYFVIIYPKELLANLAFHTVTIIFLLGLLSLLIEVLILFYILRLNIAKPLQTFVTATEKIADGHFSAVRELDTRRSDELGTLAKALNIMSYKLEDNFNIMEKTVQERTQALATANNAILQLNKQLEKENLRMGAELAVTRKLQQMVLPREKELKNIKGLEISGYMEPASEVGGDYYDVLQQNGRVKISIGDVTGHGLESGVLMLMVQTAVRTLLMSDVTDPHIFLNTLNRIIYSNIKRMCSDKNLTLSLIDYEDGVMKLSGQHEEVLVVRKNTDVERIDTINLGFMLGLEPDISAFVEQREVDIQLGDGIVLYTDGITEAFNAKREAYGLERLCRIISQSWSLSTTEIRDQVINDVKKHIGTTHISDDITLLVIKKI